MIFIVWFNRWSGAWIMMGRGAGRSVMYILDSPPSSRKKNFKYKKRHRNWHYNAIYLRLAGQFSINL